MAGVAALVLLGGAAAYAYDVLVLANYETTDNAYVQGNLVQITPQAAGTVIAIAADDTDAVQAGQVLVRLDPADAQVALEQAEAQLAQTVREVRSLYAGNAPLQAQIAAREADAARARSELVRAQDDVARREALVQRGAIGREEFDHVRAQLDAARSSLTAAESAVRAAREQLAVNQALTQGIPIEAHPSVRQAAARVHEAWLARQRTEIRAPVDGVVARRSVQLGQRLQAGAPLMALVALDRLWVDANFKEGQLRDVRVGQPVTLHADLWGDDIAFHGRVEGLGAGTGAAFALLPAQNATGNWIKVVQRVPVRIALDPQELARHPLRVGLSMQVSVDIRDRSGPTLAPSTPPAGVQTPVFEALQRGADEAVRRIIAANLGEPARAGTASAAREPGPAPARALH